MATHTMIKLLKSVITQNASGSRCIHGTSPLCIIQAGKYRPTKNRSKPLTYEQSFPPPHIAHTKSWNSWNTTTLDGGLKVSETLIGDMFIRKFITGTFHGRVASEIIIKRQHNIIRISGLIVKSLPEPKIAFLIGYTEELLGYWFQCPVKVEFQFISKSTDAVFKYI